MIDTSFKFAGDLRKAYQDNEGRYYIVGVASDTGVDRDGERMAESALVAMKRCIDDGIYTLDGEWSQVPLHGGHEEEIDRHYGWVMKAELVRNEGSGLLELHITAELDPLSSTAMSLYQKLLRGSQMGRPLRMGFSVGGKVKAAGEEWDHDAMCYRRVFQDVALREMTITSRPSNPRSFVAILAKSVPWDRIKSRRVDLDDLEEIMEDEFTKNAETAAEAVEETVEKAAEETVVAAEASVADEAVEKTEESETAEEQVAKTNAASEAVEEGAVEETVEKAAEGEGKAEEVVEKATDPLAELRDQLADVMKHLVVLGNAVTTLAKSQVVEEPAQADEGEIAKQVEETQAVVEETVEKSVAVVADAPAEVSIEERIAQAIESAVTKVVAPLQARIDELESQEVDLSISVQKAKYAEGVDIFKQFEDEAAEMDGPNALALSVRKAFGRKS